VQVGSEHLAVADVGERGVEHPAGLAHEPLRGPRVAVVEVGDDSVQQVGCDRADGAELVDGGQVDDPLADELLCALGQLEDLHAGGDALLGPAERLRGAVLGQAAIERRADGLGLLVGVQLLARDVLDGAVGVLGHGTAHDDRHLRQIKRARSGDAVKASGEFKPVAVVVADDDRDDDALELDRAGERLDVLGVEVADVVGDADVDERDMAPRLLGGGHQALLCFGASGPATARTAASRGPCGSAGSAAARGSCRPRRLRARVPRRRTT
jgi:hypothetical protein